MKRPWDTAFTVLIIMVGVESMFLIRQNLEHVLDQGIPQLRQCRAITTVAASLDLRALSTILNMSRSTWERRHFSLNPRAGARWIIPPLVQRAVLTSIILVHMKRRTPFQRL
ncbi:hypothetical protein EDB89DRAFT_1947732, partial [Lactarius sanguifluus]